MKTRHTRKFTCATLLSAGLALPALGGTYFSQTFDTGFANDGTVPDGSLNGWTDTRTVTGAGVHHVSDVRVTLSISNGYNGDLYAYLAHSNGMAILLNRVGVASTNVFGFDDTGFNVTLSAAGTHDVHFYDQFSPSFDTDGALTGTWQPDARGIDPLSALAAFDAPGSLNFSVFNGLDPNGDWTLYIADASAGGEQSTVLSWGLQIDAGTEPAANLVITSVNGGADVVAGTPFSVVLEAQDVNGDPASVVADTVVTLSLHTGTGTLGGTLTGTITAGTSSVTISGITYAKAETGVEITATRTSGDILSPATSSSFNVVAGAFAHLQVLMPGETNAPGTATGKTGTPSPETVDVPFDVIVYAVDANWNIISTNDTVHFTSTDPSAILPADAPLSGGTGTFSVTLVTGGTNSVTVSDVTNPGIGSNTSSPTSVGAGSQTITFPAIGNQTYGVPPITLTATSSSDLPVSYTVSSGPATVLANILTITGAGSVTIQAAQPGNPNWSPATPVNQTISVAPKVVTGSITASNKIYDGNTSATISSRNLSGVINSDNVSLTGGTATFSDPTVANGKIVSATGLALSGTQAGNYVLSSTTATTSANITAGTVTIASGLSAVNKAYDGTTSAGLSSNNVVLIGVLPADASKVVLSTNGYLANFDTASVGNNKPVTVSGLTLTGTAAPNYTLIQPTNLTAAIIGKTVTIASGLLANNKLFDGTTTATLTSNNVVLIGVLTADVNNVSLSTNGYVANFNNPTVGNNKPVTVTGLTLTGSAVGNYTLAQPSLTANIIPDTVAKLAFTTQPGSANPGAPFGQQPVVKSQDQFGNDSTAGLPAHLLVTVTLTSGTGPLQGTITIDIGTAAGNGTGRFTDLRIDAPGPKQLTVSATGLTSAVSVIFNVPEVAPVAHTATFSRPRNVPLKILISDLLTNATDLNGSALTLVGVSSASTNGAAINTNATFVLYNLPPGGNVPDQFLYSVSDGTLTGAGNVLVTIQPVPTGTNYNIVAYGVVNGHPTMTFAAVPGFTYVVQRTQDLTGIPTWADLMTTNAPPDGLFEFVDQNPPVGNVFYRAINE
jgi:subtilisin-like proprotein convertase family protein